MPPKALIILLLALTLTACGVPTSGTNATPTSGPNPSPGNPPTPGAIAQPTAVSSDAAQLEQPFTLRIGKSLTLADDNLKVTFAEVPYDQRCGSCTASGNAEVVLRLTPTGGAEQEVRLQAFPVTRNYAEALPYVVQMLDLRPKRLHPPDEVDASQYAVSLKITKPTVTCQPQSDDPDGYLLKLCRYVQLRQIGVAPADPTQYRIKNVEQRQFNGRAVVWVFLNCCGMGDIGIIDKETGEVIDFRPGAH